MNDNNQHHNQRPPMKQYRHESEFSESAKQHAATGKFMIIICWCIILGLGYLFFTWHNRTGAYDTETKYSDTAVEIHIPLTRGDKYEVFGSINNVGVTFLVDTGASIVAVPPKVAEAAGLKKGLAISINTAAGSETAYLTKIDKLVINKHIVLYNVNASINPNMHEETILLGMGALKQINFKHTRNVLILRENR